MQQSLVFSSATSLSWRTVAHGRSAWIFQNIKSVQLEKTKKVESQCVRDEGGRLLRDKGRFRERWVRFFRSLLGFKSDLLDPDISKRLPQQPVGSALGIELTQEEIATAMKAMAKRESSGAGRASRGTAETRTSQQDRTILKSSTDSPPTFRARGKSHSSGKTRSLPYSTFSSNHKDQV